MDIRTNSKTPQQNNSGNDCDKRIPVYKPGDAEAWLARQVARSFRIKAAAIYAPQRATARVSLARHTAMYLMHVVLRRPYADVAVSFRRHRTSVHYACNRIEDRRDDLKFDERVSRLERALVGRWGRR